MVRVDLPDLIVIAVYRSPSNNSNEDRKEFIKLLSDLQHTSKTVVVCGDMNISYNPGQPTSNVLSFNMDKQGFRQLLRYPTHIKGNILDHVYVRVPESAGPITPSCTLYNPYYSDHDAPLLILKRELKAKK